MSVYRIRRVGKADTQGLMNTLNNIDWASIVQSWARPSDEQDFDVEVADSSKYNEFVSIVHRHGYQVIKT